MPAVAVTGLGAVTAFGLGVDSLWQGLLQGRSAIAELQRGASQHLRMTMAAEVTAYRAEDHLADRDFNELDRFAQLALVAGREAWRHAGLLQQQPPPQAVAVVSGSAVGGKESEDAGYARLYGEGRARASPLTVPRAMAGAASSRLARELGARGPCASHASACAASSHAIAHAALLIASGRAEVALAGGSEAPLAQGHLLAWDALRVLSPSVARPFDRARDGCTLGEGAAYLVLENANRARARGAPVLALLAGVGESCDSGPLTSPDAEGAARALRAALADAGVAAAAVDYVNAHGTATLLNDRAEAQALRAVLGQRVEAVADRAEPGCWVSSTKGAHGHLLGAAGALEAVITVLALHHGIAPPNVGCREADPACGLRIALQPQPQRLQVALSSTLAFGGLNIALCFVAAR